MEAARAYLVTERRRRKLTIAAMARQFGVTRSHMFYVLNGQRNPTIKLAQSGRDEYPELLTLLVNEITKPVARKKAS